MKALTKQNVALYLVHRKPYDQYVFDSDIVRVTKYKNRHSLSNFKIPKVNIIIYYAS